MKSDEVHEVGAIAPHGEIVFLEIFAGSAQLTQAMRRVGVTCLPPEDIASGGTEFRDEERVNELKEKLKDLASAGKRLVLHLAPPCSTFSHARDRSARTKVRDAQHVAGIDPRPEEVVEANDIATKAIRLAAWAARELGAQVSVENPRASYLWPFWDSLGIQCDFEDLEFSMCRFGAAYNKEGHPSQMPERGPEESWPTVP